MKKDVFIIETEDGYQEASMPVLEDDSMFFNGEIIKTERGEVEKYVDATDQHLSIDQLLEKKRKEFADAEELRNQKFKDTKKAALKHKELVADRFDIFAPRSEFGLHQRSFMLLVQQQVMVNLPLPNKLLHTLLCVVRRF